MTVIGHHTCYTCWSVVILYMPCCPPTNAVLPTCPPSSPNNNITCSAIYVTYIHRFPHPFTVRRLKAGRPIPVPNSGLQVTQLGHVKDLAVAFNRVLLNPVASKQIYNISGERCVMLLIDMLQWLIDMLQWLLSCASYTHPMCFLVCLPLIKTQSRFLRAHPSTGM